MQAKMVLNGRQIQNHCLGELRKKSKPTQFHPQPFNAWSDILVRDLVGSHYFLEAAVFGASQNPSTVDRKSRLMTGLLRLMVGKGLVKQDGSDWQLPGRTSKISHRNVINVHYYVIIWKVCYLFSDTLSWNLLPLPMINSSQKYA